MHEMVNNAPAESGARRPRLLWANAFCLLDTSSGAAMAVRQMLLQLVEYGFEVKILGATNFDHPRGAIGLGSHWKQVLASKGTFVKGIDGPLEHELLVTAGTVRRNMTCSEESAWFARYRQVLQAFEPDLVVTYGGKVLDMLLTSEAKYHGIPVVFYLANGSYQHKRFSRDVDLILTNSLASAQLYKKRLGKDLSVVGIFVDPEPVVAREHERKHVLFINPVPEKGATIVVRLAMLMENSRPDILFEVVESRGKWDAVLHRVTSALGNPRTRLDNVRITRHTRDMRSVYSRARLLLAPSLWWESAGRVIAEALLNELPVVVSESGGCAEMAGEGGLVLKLPKTCYQPPYTCLPPDKRLQPLVEHIERLYDDSKYYDQWCERARHAARKHSLENNTQSLIKAIESLVGRKYHSDKITFHY